MSRLLVWASRPTSTANISVSYSDDDYENFSTARDLDISVARPTLTRLGQFRERAFKLTFTANFPLLLQGLEVDFIMGA